MQAPTQHELESAITDLCYVAHQSALYVYWTQYGPAPIDGKGQPVFGELSEYYTNGIIEVALLFIRKTTEFFMPPKGNEKGDDLRAFHFLPNWRGTWVVDDSDYRDLHKRVGHITVMEARHGKRDWPIISFTSKAVRQWIDFLKQISVMDEYREAADQANASAAIMVLSSVLAECERRLGQ